VTDYPFRPDHEDASVRAMQADRRALVSQTPTFRPYEHHQPPQEKTDD